MLAERVEQLRELIRDGQVDTILCVTPDLWGRLVGKRVTARTFLALAEHGEGIHASLYLFVVDLDMQPHPGFDLTSWETGFHDFVMVPDLSTLRLVPWLEKTALVMCDARTEGTGEPVEVSPRRILQRQVERAKMLGLSVKCGSELEVFFYRQTYEEAWKAGYLDLDALSWYRSDYHVLQTTKDEWLIGKIRRYMDGAGMEVESSKGEWGLGQHEINLWYGDALDMADRHAIYKNGVKEIAALSGLSATCMAKPWGDEIGSSFHIHSSLWSADGAEPLSWDPQGRHHMSENFRHYVGGMMSTTREMAWLYAPFVNSYRRYQAESFAPTAIAWGEDNRTCAFRIVGRETTFRLEVRVPGADANPYLAMAAMISGGLHGIEHLVEPPDPYRGNAYEADDLEQVPTCLGEAIEALRGSEVARRALGDEVFEHLVRLAGHEQRAFDAARPEEGDSHGTVTDWERRRYFERV